MARVSRREGEVHRVLNVVKREGEFVLRHEDEREEIRKVEFGREGRREEWK